MDIKEQLKKRSIIKGMLTKFKDYVSNLQQLGIDKINATQIKDLTMRSEKFQNLLVEFDKLQSVIELASDDIDIQLNEREVVESQFFWLISSAQIIIESPSHHTKQGVTEDESASQCSHNSANNFNSIRLPTISLPKFDGNYLKWLEFRDMFDSMVNSNESIPPINKFHYLRSSLEGSAAVVIRAMELTNDNYKNAWKTLCDRYNNNNILINNHLKSLLSIEPMLKESFKAIRYLIDHLSKNLRSLQILGLPTDKWDILVIFIVSSKLDSNTSRKWEECKNSRTHLPTLEDFFTFLRSHADVLETTYFNRCDSKPSVSHFQNKSTKSFFAASQSQPKIYLCVICNKNHLVYECSKFKEMNYNDRVREVSKYKLCNNCLRGGHRDSQCRLKGTCRECRGKHNTLLHNSNNTSPDESTSSESTPPESFNSCVSSVQMTHTLLCTAQVEIVNEANNKRLIARALLDTGSQSSFLAENTFNKLGFRRKDCETIKVSGINNMKCNISGSCKIKLNSCINTFSINLSCLIVPTITGNLPTIEINPQEINMPTNIKLADSRFFKPSSIDVLLGSDVFWSVIMPNQIKLGTNMPTLQESQLGWLVAGPVGFAKCIKNISCNFSHVSDLDKSLKKFWEIEELPTETKTLSLEEQFCENNFLENTTRLSNGRFCVMMPLKEPESNLGDSFYIAKNRLLNLENKLNKNLQLKQSYCDFIKEYRTLGHLSEIARPAFGCYLPHHCVIRDKSETTKLRVVFDASAKTSSGKSLNQIQGIGAVVQSDLLSILLRFRGHRFILLGDIEKMYRQVALSPSQRHLQLILWRNESNDIIVLQLNTVTYGMASAPFLGTRSLLQLSRECPDEKIATIIQSDFYMDDLNTGAETEAEIQYIYNEVKNVLDSACFPLRKIRTNCSQALLNNSNSSQDLIDLTKESSVLGLRYDPKYDIIQFSANIPPPPQITKRSVISTICKIFDPLGLICACIIKAKIFLQHLWIAKLSWEEPIPQNLLHVWSNFINNLHFISNIKINRNVLCESPRSIELHCFVDASMHAYAGCIYLRSIGRDGRVTVRLLCAKARVTPVKPTTIPRLELLGALLGARLCNKVINSFRFQINSKIFWTDSMVVLGWLKTDVKNLKMFVCNRVNEINDLTSGSQWRHVPTDMNPADLASRGVDPQSMHASSLWWEGPSYLKKVTSEWPQNSIVVNDLPEIKATSIIAAIQIDTNEILDFNKYSRLVKLNRMFAYVLRFIKNCKKGIKLCGSLNSNELNNALNYLIKLSQLETFNSEIILIKQGKILHKKSKLLPLTPIIDSDNILRVGGRLNNSEFKYDKRHPIILDSKHNLTKLIMANEHLRLFHAGPQLMLASVRDRFWPIGGRCLARRIAKRCVTCTRLRASTMQPIMGHLPEARTNCTFPFYSSGTDFAGPFMISNRKGRGNQISKCYLCLFVCLSTKAVHLELVSDLSTQAFILCLRRFISRRGKPYEIYCDNGKNFVGACNELGRLLKSSRQSVYEYASTEGIRFVHSPAYSPNFGGIFEAGIKSAKFHLKRIAGNASLTFEELTTLFVQIEAILNSRPLAPLSSNCTDPCPLTPGHFLIGRPLTSIPTVPLNETRPNRYELIEQIRQHFWERWRHEYIAELQQRTKWRTPQRELTCGDVVILKEDNLPPLQWKLGRVVRLYPGTDGVSRVADVTTSKGIIRRAINKMCLLPTTEPNDGEDED